MNERAAKYIVGVLVLLFPAVSLIRWASHAEEAGIAAPESRWIHSIIVTSGHWPERGAELDPFFGSFQKGAALVEQCYAPSSDPVASAVSLWTGRWPTSHGATSANMSLEEGAWSVASAARAAGTRTAAILAEPLATAGRIEGFETVIEEPGAGASELARHAREFLSELPDERVLVWLHLEDAGPGASEVALLLSAIRGEMQASERAIDTLTVIAGLNSQRSPSADDSIPKLDASLRAPLWVELPSRVNGGRRSSGAASLVDLAGALCELLQLRLPDQAQDQAPLQSRTAELGVKLKGGGGYNWLLLSDDKQCVLRFGKTRVVGHLDSNGQVQITSTSESQDPTSDGPFQPTTGELSQRQAHQLRSLMTELQAAAHPGTESGSH